jgi:hypothetical protein
MHLSIVCVKAALILDACKFSKRYLYKGMRLAEAHHVKLTYIYEVSEIVFL